MKKYFMLAALACCLGVNVANAAETVEVKMVQVQEDSPFVGNWKMIVKDTPMGDFELPISIAQNEDGTFTMKAEELGETKGELNEGKLIFIIDTQGVSVDIVLESVDADNLKGMSMGEWPMTATRIKE